MIIFVVKSLEGFGWNNVVPASQTVAQHYFTIGPMYLVIWVVTFRGNKASPAWQSERTRDTYPILFQCWASVDRSILKKHWVNAMCGAKYIAHPVLY